jgi:Kef-type K+ transport system membrane component KefB
MSSQDFLTFFVELLVLLVASRALGQVFRAVRQPAVIGELLAGVLIGPSVFGKLFPELHRQLFPTPPGHMLPPALDGFCMLGVTLLMLAAGLEVDLSLLLRQKRLTFFCALFGSVVPLAVGVGAGFFIFQPQSAPDPTSRLVFALVLGINLAMSALPVIAKTLLDLGMYRTRVGVVILAAALVDDLGVWLLFSLAMSLAGGHGGEGGSVMSTVLLTLALVTGALTAGRSAANHALRWVEKAMPSPGGAVTLTVAAGLLLASLALWIGVHPVFGSLLAGVAIGSAPALRPESRAAVYDFILATFAPVFFASIGLRMDFVANFAPALVAWIFLLGCAGKLTGATLGARLGGMSWRESCAVAAGLNSRGIMGIVLGLVALEYGVIDKRMFVALAFLGVGTSLISGPLLRVCLGTPSAVPANGK